MSETSVYYVGKKYFRQKKILELPSCRRSTQVYSGIVGRSRKRRELIGHEVTEQQGMGGHRALLDRLKGSHKRNWAEE